VRSANSRRNARQVPAVFILRHVDGMDLQEIASGLGISLATVKRYLAKALGFDPQGHSSRGEASTGLLGAPAPSRLSGQATMKGRTPTIIEDVASLAEHSLGQVTEAELNQGWQRLASRLADEQILESPISLPSPVFMGQVGFGRGDRPCARHRGPIACRCSRRIAPALRGRGHKRSAG